MKTCSGRWLTAECVGPSEWGEQVISREETLSAEQTSAQHVQKGFGNLHSLGCPQPTFHCSTEKEKLLSLGLFCFEGKNGNRECQHLSPSKKKTQTDNSANVRDCISLPWAAGRQEERMRGGAAGARAKIFHPLGGMKNPEL